MSNTLHVPSRNTGLLTQRCDPYGAESRIQLMGGMFPESMNGPHHWFCPNNADARYRMVCTGGRYGHAVANDGGSFKPYVCDGGHKGQIMALCKEHVAEIGRRQAGFCPACGFARHIPEVRSVLERIDWLQQQLQYHDPFDFIGQLKIQHAIEAEGHKMTEFYEQGITHRCPLVLREVS